MSGLKKKRLVLLMAGISALLWLPLATASAQQATTTTTSTNQTLPTPTTALTGLSVQNAQRSQYGTYERALIKEASQQTITSSKGAELVFSYVLEFRTGHLQGTTQKITVTPSSLPVGFKPEVGDMVVVYVQPDINQAVPIVFFESYDRQNTFFWLIAILVVCGLFFAGWKSLKIPLIYLLAFVLCFKVAIPFYVLDWPGWVTALILLVLFSGASTLLLAGKGRQSLISLVGTLASGLLSYILMLITFSWAHLGGAIELSLGNNPLLDPKDLMIFGSWLVILCFQQDMAVAISYGLSEIKRITGGLSFKALFQSGMVIGRERLVNLTPILSLAFLGIPIILLAQGTSADYPWLKFINTEAVTQAIALPITGLISLILTVPLVSLIITLANARQINREVDPLRRAVSWRQTETTVETTETVE
ncbi:MAG: YibE/F family protein [Patescibacteria group bacterium]|jgi:uncharacterized membrane protein